VKHTPISLPAALRVALALALLLAVGDSAHPARAESGQPARAESKAESKAKMQSLDEQVQDIKSDVLGIGTQLDRLEERLLYPSNTEVAVFVSVAEGETFRLDSVQIQIDGEPVARHIYSFKELEALQKGGVQRLYTGNVRTGEHRLDVHVAGKSGTSDVNASQTFGFRKEAGPKLVGITLAGGGSSIELGGW
jgi:hypothetical protein